MYVVTVRLAVDQETLDEHRTLLTILNKEHGVLGRRKREGGERRRERGEGGGGEGEREKGKKREGEEREGGREVTILAQMRSPIYIFKDHRYSYM